MSRVPESQNFRVLEAPVRGCLSTLTLLIFTLSRMTLNYYLDHFDTFGENFAFDTFKNDTFESVWVDRHHLSYSDSTLNSSYVIFLHFSEYKLIKNPSFDLTPTIGILSLFESLFQLMQLISGEGSSRSSNFPWGFVLTWGQSGWILFVIFGLRIGGGLYDCLVSR